MKLDGIQAFVAVVEAGSISAAARRLRLSVSVVSDRLAELERSLGARLLHRTTRRISLTEDGAAFHLRASRIVREVDEAAAELAESRGTLAGPLRLSAPVTFGRMHLGPALYPFLARNPLIELTLDLDDRRVDAASTGFDAVVRHGPMVDSRLVAWQLASSQRILVASPAYLAAQGVPGSPDDLAQHRGLFYSNRGVADWRFVTAAGPLTIRAKVGLTMNNGDMMRDAAIAGLGIAHLPSFICSEAVRNGALVAIDVGIRAEPECIFVAHAEGRQVSAKLRALVAHLRATFGDPPYWDRPAG